MNEIANNWKEDYEKFLLESCTVDTGVYSNRENEFKKLYFPRTFYKYGNLDGDHYIDSVSGEYIYLNSIDRFEDDLECCATALFSPKQLTVDYLVQKNNGLEEMRVLAGVFLSTEQFDYELSLAVDNKLPIDEFLEIIMSKSSVPTDMKKLLIDQVHAAFADGDSEISSAFKHNLRDDYLIGCITDNNYSKDMWAKYASDYTGICIEYDISSIIEDCFPVYYYPELPEMSSIIENGLYYYAICRKLEKWEFEQEMRIICDRKYGNKLKLTAKSITITDLCKRTELIEKLTSSKSIHLHKIKHNDILK